MKLTKIIAGVLVGVVVGTILELRFIAVFEFPILLSSAVFIGAFLPAIIVFKNSRYAIRKKQLFEHLPICAADFIDLVMRNMRYRKKVRADVQAELTAHFEDELRDCKSEEEKEQKAERLIEGFGDVKLLAVLLRRAKKRCRPLWRTIAARTFQTAGVLILCFIVYTIWFLTGKPNIAIDYVALLNETARPGVLRDDNAWPHYEKAINLFVEPSEELENIDAFKNYKEEIKAFSELTDDEKAKIGKWIKENEPAWKEFITASVKSYCYKKAHYDEKDVGKWLMRITLPHLRSLRDLARLGIWRSRMEIQQGHISQGFEDCFVLARVGRHWQGKGWLIEQLVGLGISRRAYEEMLHIAAAAKLSTVDLKQVQQQLSQLYPQGYPMIDTESQKLFFLDVVQHLFTEGGVGGGHLIPKRWAFLEQQIRNVYEPEFEGYMIIRYTVAGIIHARRDETIAKANELCNQLNEIAKMTPYERYISNINQDDIVSALPERRYFLIRTFVLGIGRASEIAYRGKSLHKAAITVLAVLRYEKEKDEYPASLDELVEAAYLKELPMDPYSDKPLVYRKTEGDFLLYSVGANFIDDSGSRYSEYPWGGYDRGDRVFWPVQR